MPLVNFAVNNAFSNFKIGVMTGNGGPGNNYPPQPAFEGGYNQLSD